MEYPTNQAHLRGNLLELPVFSHESNGKRFFRFFLEVARLSGAVDTLPVIIQQGCLNELDLSGGEMLDVVGQVRSHNLRTSTGRRLLIFVFGQTLTAQDGPAVNEISLCGNLCREPSYRRTSSFPWEKNPHCPGSSSRISVNTPLPGILPGPKSNSWAAPSRLRAGGLCGWARMVLISEANRSPPPICR